MKAISYHVVGIRPIKFMETPSGGLAVLKMNWETGVFELGMEFYARAYSSDGDVEQVSEDEFIEQVESLRAQRLIGEGPVYALYGLIKAMETEARASGRAPSLEARKWLTEVKRQTYGMFLAEHPDPEYP
jgi:hypothetical protein